MVGVAATRPMAMRVTPAIGLGALVLAANSLPVLCPFRVTTGHVCPLCGMTRAAGELAVGDLTSAWRFHPLVFLLTAQVLAVGVFYAIRRHGPSSRTMNTGLALTALAFLATWLIRWRLDLLAPLS